jgi:hypothetical protein
MTQPLRLVPQLAVSITSPTGCVSTKPLRDTVEITSHDQGVLDETKTPAYPVTFESDKDLTDDDADDLEICNGGDPVGIADLERRPAGGPDGGVEGGKVTD